MSNNNLSNNNRNLRIGPNWSSCIIAIIVIISLVVGSIIYTVDLKNMLIIIALIVVSLFLIYQNFNITVFSEEGIEFRRLCVFPQHTPWEGISQIGIATKGGIQRNASIAFIMIIKKPCEKFNPAVDKGGKFLDKYGKHIIVADATEANIIKLEEFYGKLDFDQRAL